MRKASLSLLVVLFASLTALDSFAQRENRPDRPDRPNRPDQPREDRRPDPSPYPVPLPHYEERLPQYEERHPQEQILSERVQQTIGRGQRIRLSQFLRSFERNAEVVSLSISAQSFAGAAQLQLLSGYSTLEYIQVRRHLSEIHINATQLGALEMLELSSMDEIYIESITARIRAGRPYGPQPQYEIQVSPYTLLTVRLNQDVVNGEVPLKRLVKEQLGLSLDGAQIERIAVEGMPIGRAASAIHVEINNRIASQVKYLSAAHRRTPLQVQSLEEIRSLRLVVSGPARIIDINIRIGAVRPSYNPIPVPVPLPLSVRIHLNQEIAPAYPLDLALFTRERSIVSSLAIETNLRARIAANMTVINRQGQIVGRAMIASGITHIALTQPSVLSELRLFTEYQVSVLGIEAQLERSRY